jgi:hypothetical protein
MTRTPHKDQPVYNLYSSHEPPGSKSTDPQLIATNP